MTVSNKAGSSMFVNMLLSALRTIFLMTIFVVLVGSTKAGSVDPTTARFLRSPSLWRWDLKPLPNIQLQAISISMNDSNHTLRSAGCYSNAPGATYVTPQHATIALGQLSLAKDFYEIKRYSRSKVLHTYGSAMIVLLRDERGPDEFSMFDIVTQALHIVSYCIYQQPEGGRFGGAFEVGMGNHFLIAVRGSFQ